MKPHIAEFDGMREAFAASDPRVPPSDKCPNRKRLWAAAAARLPLEERCEILDHTFECAYCAESWRLAVELGAKPDVPLSSHVAAILWHDLQFVIDVGKRLRGFLEDISRHTATWQLISAAIVVVVAGLALLGPDFVPVQNGDNPSLGGTVSRGGPEIESLVPDDEILPREAAVLRWTGPPETEYDLLVTTEDGQPLDSAVIRGESEYEIPAEKLRDLEPGSVVLWKVSPRPPGRHVEEPKSFRIRVE